MHSLLENNFYLNYIFRILELESLEHKNVSAVQYSLLSSVDLELFGLKVF